MLIELLNHRRAVRHYSEQPIDADTVRACLEQARLAPSSSTSSSTLPTRRPCKHSPPPVSANNRRQPRSKWLFSLPGKTYSANVPGR